VKGLGELVPMKPILYRPVLLVLLSIVAAGCGYRSKPADVVLHNGVILTLDAQGTEAQAVAVQDGRVIEVGAERAILNKYAAQREVDLKGAVLVPGLMDAHAHFVGFAKSLANADLVGTESVDAVLDRTRDHAQRFPEGWIVGCIAPAALLVCTVDRTGLPVEANSKATLAVSRSRISPTMTTSGSCRKMARKVAAKVRPTL